MQGTSLVLQSVEQVENENETVDNHATSCLKRRQEWSLFVFSPENKFRRLLKIHKYQWFDRVVLLLILINCIVMAMEEPGLDKNSEVVKIQFCNLCVVVGLMLSYLYFILDGSVYSNNAVYFHSSIYD